MFYFHSLCFNLIFIFFFTLQAVLCIQYSHLHSTHLALAYLPVLIFCLLFPSFYFKFMLKIAWQIYFFLEMPWERKGYPPFSMNVLHLEMRKSPTTKSFFYQMPSIRLQQTYRQLFLMNLLLFILTTEQYLSLAKELMRILLASGLRERVIINQVCFFFIWKRYAVSLIDISWNFSGSSLKTCITYLYV